MYFWITVKVAIKSLLANKLRSILAMLGIIIGVSAVIAMLALGAGAQAQVIKQISAMGTDLLIVQPGQRGSHGVASGTQQNLTVQDAEAIQREVHGIRQISPAVGGMAQVKHLANNSQISVTGAAPTYFAIRNFELDRGRPFSDAQVDAMDRVAIIGPTAATNLFGTDDPLKQVIKVKGINFRVVGVLKPKGSQGWFNPDNQVVIPYTTAMKQLYGVDYLREIDIQAADKKDLDQMQKDVNALLRRRHRIADDVPDDACDFNIFNQAEMLKTASTVTSVFRMLLGGIAGISLLVGGIGIMNIMLVTVTERTREIGIRKAVGAKNADILKQFLIESVIMSGLGGMLGIALGVGMARGIGIFTPFMPVVQISSVALALGVAAGVGVFFGLYPASRAAKLDPIESLRYE